ncbi:MAG: hypothetical protein JXR25_05405 [Pontiellaceae bacterium]|nr:hypothetical protein [Pontiellaceae bacterium]MBN2784242.1 hypothetical protein [Pontiellaceae bacterium]
MGKIKRINKGAPSGLIVSLALHAAAFFVAGLFVVFTVVTKKEPEFVPPPPVERPKMQLKKPKVKVQKSSNPKPSSRIVAKVKTKEMPEIQLPDLMGTGDGLLGAGTGLGGEFLDLPEIKELSVFGNEVTSGNDLVGTFYDFKRDAQGRPRAIIADGSVPNDLDTIIHDFMARGWRTSSLAKYYASPKKLYASCICIGTVQSLLAPEAFGEDTEGWGWAVVYRGKLVYPEDIKFRFRGVGDKFMGVRVDGKIVMICHYRGDGRQYFADLWWPSASDARVYPMGESKQQVGDWIELKGGVPVDIEVILGDREGGLVYHQLAVEVEGVEYPRNPYGAGPCCPVFKTENLSRAQIDALCMDVYSGDVNLTNGPVFCDFFPPEPDYTDHPATNIPPVFVKDDAKKIRTWTSKDGRTIDGRFLLQSEDYVLLEVESRQQKLPLDALSDEDLQFVKLAKPPKFNIEYVKDSDQIDVSKLVGPFIDPRAMSVHDWTFGATIKQTSSGDYDDLLKVEVFALGEQINDQDKYILFDRKVEYFKPSEYGRKKPFEIKTRTVRVRKYNNRPNPPTPFRGQTPGGHMVVISDSQGRIIQYEATSNFLFENLTRMRKMDVGAYFDDNCVRVFPTTPGPDDRADWVLMGGDGNDG